MDVRSILASVEAAYAVYEKISEMAHDLAPLLKSDDQALLKAKLAELMAQNDAARARRHAKLQAAAQQP